MSLWKKLQKDKPPEEIEFQGLCVKPLRNAFYDSLIEHVGKNAAMKRDTTFMLEPDELHDALDIGSIRNALKMAYPFDNFEINYWHNPESHWVVVVVEPETK